MIDHDRDDHRQPAGMAGVQALLPNPHPIAQQVQGDPRFHVAFVFEQDVDIPGSATLWIDFVQQIGRMLRQARIQK